MVNLRVAWPLPPVLPFVRNAHTIRGRRERWSEPPKQQRRGDGACGLPKPETGHIGQADALPVRLLEETRA